MQSPGALDLDMYQGATWEYTLTWKLNGAPVDLSAYSARMMARSSYAAASAVLSLTNGSGITLGGTAGTIVLAASAVTTAGVAAAQYVYDLELVSGGTVTRLVEGYLNVSPEATR